MKHITPSEAELQDLKHAARSVPRMIGTFICDECRNRGFPELSIEVRTQAKDERFCSFECVDAWRLTNTIMEVRDAAE